MKDSTSLVPAVDAPLRGGSTLRAPANALARAVAWAFVRMLMGLLAAAILVFSYTTA